jgi:peptidoglycan biosynthesis protein MviN/MurJ (putative lipid II flippase)
MLRRSLSSMLTGLLIAVPILLTAYAAQTDWTPNKIALIAVVTVASASIMALIDELGLDRRIGAEGIRQRGPSKAE